MKKVSIVTPVYCVEKYIAGCMQSVIDQTYSNIEFVLVDDCGNDHSIEIVEKVISNTHKEGLSFNLIRHSKNQGVAAARSHAMQAATGEYIFCLDSDDKLESECIEHLVKRMEETDADFVVCRHYSDQENASLGGDLCAPVDMLHTNEECLHAFAKLWFNVAPWCKLLKRSFIEKYNLYFREGIVNEDAPWIFQLCLNATKIAFLDEQLYYYRYNSGSIMSSAKKKIVNDSNAIALQIFYDEIIARPNIWENKDLYMIYMRQIILYYTMSARQFGFFYYMGKIKWLKSHGYASAWFKSKNIPASYRIWNQAFRLPGWIAGILTYMLIKVQNLKR